MHDYGILLNFAISGGIIFVFGRMSVKSWLLGYVPCISRQSMNAKNWVEEICQI